MKIAEGSWAWYELPFSRRAELSRIAPADMPKLSIECRNNLLEAMAPSFSRAYYVSFTRTVDVTGDESEKIVIEKVQFRRTVAGKFWNSVLEKCPIADLSGPYLDRSDADGFLEEWLLLESFDRQDCHLKMIEHLEFMFRTPGMPKGLASKIEEILDDTPYYIDYSVNPVSIELTALPANTTAAQRAIRLARNAGLTQAANHLQKSEEKIGVSDYPGALDECGRALESIVQVIDPGTKKKSLGACLKSSKIKEIFKHSALHGAISQLYGYLSDEAGVRHARGNEKSKVDRELAIFFYDVSAAFAEYLVSAHRKSKKYGKKKKK
ncbi:MAG: hypothetical protein MPK31_04535 [Gammaproteobacteria bacterium]|nr:hypothetical protein [Gammaproteobacteria bacterium]MDA8003011.1 hypothetical protein [Alphaproteobacteria bacterium]